MSPSASNLRTTASLLVGVSGMVSPLANSTTGRNSLSRSFSVEESNSPLGGRQANHTFFSIEEVATSREGWVLGGQNQPVLSLLISRPLAAGLGQAFPYLLHWSSGEEGALKFLVM